MPFLGPVIAWIATTLAVSTAVATSIVVTGITAAVNFGINAIIGALSPKPKPQNIDQMASRNITVRQAAAPGSITIGRDEIGGIIVFMDSRGSNNEYLDVVVAFNMQEIDAFESVKFDADVLTLDMTNLNAGNVVSDTGKYAGYVRAQGRLGTTSQTALSGLIAANSNWTTDHKGLGIAYIWFELKFNQDLFSNGLPNIKAKLRGMKATDPRTGTRAWTQNPAVIEYQYFIDSDIGLATDTAKMNTTVCNAACNVCEEAVSLAAGGTEDRYQVNGTVSLDQAPVDILRAINGAMGAFTTYVSGKWGIYPAAWRAPSFTLNTSHFRDRIQMSTRVRRSELFNAVKGVYKAANKDYQPDDYPPYFQSSDRGFGSDAYYAEDGNLRIFSELDFTFVTSSSQAQRLAKIYLERQRRQKQLTAACTALCYQVAPPEVINVTHAGLNLSSDTFEVTDVQLGVEQSKAMGEENQSAPVLATILTLRQTDANVYAWSTAEEISTGAPAAVTNPGTVTIPAPTGVTLTSGSGTVLTRTDGIKISRIKVAWTQPASAFVTSGGVIQLWYKKHADSTWTSLGVVDGNDVEYYIEGVDDGVAYDVRLQAVSVDNRRSAFATVNNHTVSGVVSNITTSTPLNGQGSIPPAGISATATIFGVGSTTPAARVTVTGGTIYRSDGTTITVPSSGPTDYTTWAGGAVANSTNYNGNIVWDILTAAIVRQEYTGNATIQTKAAAFVDGKIPINYGVNFTTPSSGGSGGGGGGGGVCFTGNVEVLIEGGKAAMEELKRNPGSLAKILGRDGKFHDAVLIEHEHFKGEMIAFDREHPDWGVVPEHAFDDQGHEVSAAELFSTRPRFMHEGPVYNVVIIDGKCYEDAYFQLASGDIPHNAKII
jgi:hypothetical protein